MTIHQDIRRSLLWGTNIQPAQMCQVGQTAKSSRLNNRISPSRPNTRNTQQLSAVCFHHFYRSSSQMALVPGTFGIDIDLQVAVLHKRQILKAAAIIPELKTGMI